MGPQAPNSTMPYAARIAGTGSAFPEKRLTNDEISTFLETNDEWIRERTGIRERRISDVKNPAEHNSSLGLRAAQRPGHPRRCVRLLGLSHQSALRFAAGQGDRAFVVGCAG